MATKKISEMTAATSLTGTELIPIVQAGLNKSVTPTILLNAYVTTQVILTHNAANNITIGSKAADGSIVLNYNCVRGALYTAGKITVLNRGGVTADVFHTWDGDDCGIDNIGAPITADFSGLYIRLNITVDNVTVNDVTFNYNSVIVKA
jgi:hypothetical protein